jgi:hypothetical protein
VAVATGRGDYFCECGSEERLCVHVLTLLMLEEDKARPGEGWGERCWTRTWAKPGAE